MSYSHLPLLPPSTPAHLPTGLDRGGVMAAPWIPSSYIDRSRPTIPTNSPYVHNVQQDIFREQIPFSSPAVARPITASAGMSGYGRPPMIAHPIHPRPIGVQPYSQPRTPHGAQEGGIFGSQMVQQGMKVGQRVPQRPALSGIFGGSPDGLGG